VRQYNRTKRARTGSKKDIVNDGNDECNLAGSILYIPSILFAHGMISPSLGLPFIFLLPLYSSAWAHQSQPLRPKAVSFMSKSSAADEVGSPQLKILGVCGGIGSGKSTACKLLVSELKCAAHIGTSKSSRS
jgi:hypothetical protein